jgi:hypothetical protein
VSIRRKRTIPATARPTFAHEGDSNFTWGFHPNFDFTAIVPPKNRTGA